MAKAKSEKAAKEKVEAPRVGGRLLDRVTSATVVLFALSLVAEKLVG